MEIAARKASLYGESTPSALDDLERLKAYGYKKAALNVVAYASTGALAWIAIQYIPEGAARSERSLYYVAGFAAALLWGRIISSLVKIVFNEDISK